MEQMEKIELVREKAGVGYTEAKAALEMNHDDVLDALCWLEQRGKSQIVGASASTADREAPQEEPHTSQEQGADFRSGIRDLVKWLRGMIYKGNRNNLVVRNRDKQSMVRIPVTLMVVLLICCFWVVLPLLVIGLFFGCSYQFEGPELGRDDLNNAMGQATEWAGNVKKEFQEKKNDNE